MRVEGFDIDILVQGFPGKTVCHGGLGWSTVVLLRGEGRVVLIDTGSFNMRRLILEQLGRRAANARVSGGSNGMSGADPADASLGEVSDRRPSTGS